MLDWALRVFSCGVSFFILTLKLHLSPLMLSDITRFREQPQLKSKPHGNTTKDCLQSTTIELWMIVKVEEFAYWLISFKISLCVFFYDLFISVWRWFLLLKFMWRISRETASYNACLFFDLFCGWWNQQSPTDTILADRHQNVKTSQVISSKHICNSSKNIAIYSNLINWLKGEESQMPASWGNVGAFAPRFYI